MKYRIVFFLAISLLLFQLWIFSSHSTNDTTSFQEKIQFPSISSQSLKKLTLKIRMETTNLIPSSFIIRKELLENFIESCEISSLLSVEESDAVIWENIDFKKKLGDPPINHIKPPGIIYIWYSLESPVTYVARWLQNKESYDMIDYISLYRQDSDVPLLYGDGLPFERLLEIPKLKKDKKVMAMVSSCSVEERIAYINELSNYISVSKYGKCFNNIPSIKKSDYYGNENTKLIGEHKFYLSFENSRCPEYVTEKLFKAFVAGTVPIIVGPKSFYGNLLPSPKSVIDASEFDSPKSLAKYLNQLDENDDLYQEYFQWKYEDLSKISQFPIKLFNQTWGEQFCNGIGNILYKGKENVPKKYSWEKLRDMKKECLNYPKLYNI